MKREKRYFQPYTIKNVRNSGKEAHFAQGIALFAWKKDSELPFIIQRPNITEMYFSIARRHNRKAGLLWNRKIVDNIKKKTDSRLQDIYGLKDPILGKGFYCLQLEHGNSIMYDFIEHLLVSIVFSYSAVEAFANRLIPSNYSELGKTKDEIEKKEQLTYKLKVIIPKYYTIESPARQQFWHRLTELEKIRNDIIHCKSGMDFHGKKEITLLERVVIGGINQKVVEAARECVEYFVKKLKNNPKYLDHHKLPTRYRFHQNIVSNFMEIVAEDSADIV